MAFAYGETLKLDQVAEMRRGRLLVRYPAAALEASSRATEVIEGIIPVLERYLGTCFEGDLRLDLLAEARASGSNPAIGLLRHALNGFSENSPRTAGLLSYQLGKIFWYRSTHEASFPGSSRSPGWLSEAILLPLLYSWSDRVSWLNYLAEQIRLVSTEKLLEPIQLETITELSPQQKRLATAQALLRGQSLLQRYPNWIRDLRTLLAGQPELSGLEGLEQLCGVPLQDLEAWFIQDIQSWRQADC
jgi:hypothetical protein